MFVLEDKLYKRYFNESIILSEFNFHYILRFSLSVREAGKIAKFSWVNSPHIIFSKRRKIYTLCGKFWAITRNWKTLLYIFLQQKKLTVKKVISYDQASNTQGVTYEFRQKYSMSDFGKSSGHKRSFFKVELIFSFEIQ